MIISASEARAGPPSEQSSQLQELELVLCPLQDFPYLQPSAWLFTLAWIFANHPAGESLLLDYSDP